jgi:hypothetical protein
MCKTLQTNFQGKSRTSKGSRDKINSSLEVLDFIDLSNPFSRGF